MILCDTSARKEEITIDIIDPDPNRCLAFRKKIQMSSKVEDILG
jgi:hypothetical protein